MLKYALTLDSCNKSLLSFEQKRKIFLINCSKKLNDIYEWEGMFIPISYKAIYSWINSLLHNIT